MKITLPKGWQGYAAAILAVAALLWAGVRAWDLGSKLTVLKDKYESLSQMADAQFKASATIIATQTGEIRKLQDLNAKLGLDVEKKKSTIADLGKKLADLEASYPDLTEPAAQIANLKAQIVQWKDRFTLAESVIADKDAIISNLRAQFIAQVVITDEWKARYEGEHAARLACDKALRAANTKIRVLQFKGNVKTIAVAVAGGYIAYKEIISKQK